MDYRLLTATLLLTLAGVTSAHDERGNRAVAKLDQDGDGLISIDEFQPPAGRKGDMMSRADADGDGLVTVEELEARHEKRMAKAQARLEARDQQFADFIARLDADSNGVISDEEARLAAFGRMDENGDGYLSGDELRPPKRDRRGKGPRGPRQSQE